MNDSILTQCIELGHACGLKTLGEAYDNINLHSMNIFEYSEIPQKINDLCHEICANYNLEYVGNENINSILI